MTTPQTTAGKALLDDCERDFGPLVVDWRERIAAIEAEARALPNHPDDGHAHYWACLRCGVNPPEATAEATADPEIARLQEALQLIRSVYLPANSRGYQLAGEALTAPPAEPPEVERQPGA